MLLFLYWLLPSDDCRTRTVSESTQSRSSPTREPFSPGWSWTLAAVVVFAVWLHPAGIVLAVLPALSGFAFGARQPEPTARLTVMLLLAGIAAAGLAYGAHAVSLWSTGLTPTSATAVYAIPTPASPASAHITSLAGLPAWLAAVALFAALGFLLLRRYPDSTAVVAVSLACAVSDQLGMLLLAGLAAVVWNPPAAKRTATVVLVAGLAAITFWTLHTSIANHAQVNWALVRSLTAAAASYPLGQLSYAIRSFPVVAALAVAGTAWSLSRSRSAPDEVHRLIAGVALLTAGLLAAFAMLSVAVAERYLLLPWTLLAVLASAGVSAITAGVPDRSAQGAVGTVGSGLTATAAAVVLVATAGVWVGHTGYVRDRDALVAVPMAEQAFAPLTGPSWTPELLRSQVQSDDLLVCTEELACVYLLGRVDFLFALPPKDVAHYVVDRGGAAAGFYAGAPVLSSPAELQRAIQDHDRTGCAVVVALKSGKVGYDEYLAILDGLRDSFDVRDVLSREDLHVSRVCRSFVNAWLMPRRVP